MAWCGIKFRLIDTGTIVIFGITLCHILQNSQAVPQRQKFL